MTTQEIQDIIKKYKSGQTMAAIAREHYLSQPTVKSILVRNNIAIRSRNKPPGWWQMVINDYNAGKDLESMARVYGYKNAKSMGAAISRLRKRGYKMNYRYDQEEQP